ncbi:50S ribosomal protein L10 [Naumannella halotolerans]|uniref:Large ribosomal subunit protein uL10 n=1 Tax=Naumannella halotolerans TaxID=993414 RepID=A0A4R7JBM5_9ACTN|nr:50S ribosomal protein L10 [Naumannella halotolerans]TDT34386.1 large subunit ribosomal protein L10 [Naumannella halotolerans]
MARPDKVATVKELTARFSDSDAVVLTEYRGLSVSALKELRRSLGDEATYAVTKNTLTQRAAKDAGIDGLDDKLVGPTAVAFINGDVATVAKGLRDFAKANPLLVLKGGVMDGRVLGAEDVTKLADLESREVLLAKLAGAMKASMSNAAALFAAPLTEAVRTFAALQAAAEENPELIGGAGTPAAEAPAAQEQQDSPAAAEEPAAE